jgi:uncharacterized membrane protein
VISEPSGNPTTPSQKPTSSIHGNERLIFLSDGVFAITITLLVLEIKVPEIPEALVATELPNALLHLLPKILAHILSFIVLGIYWSGHHNTFMHIKRHNRFLLWLNILFLMCVASMPFATGLLSQYHEHLLSIVTYSGILAGAGLVMDLKCVSHNSQYSEEDIDSEFVAFVTKGNRLHRKYILLSLTISFVFSITLLNFLIIIGVPLHVPKPLDDGHPHNLLLKRPGRIASTPIHPF